MNCFSAGLFLVALASLTQIATPQQGGIGFEKVFRYPNMCGVDILSYFELEVTNPRHDRSGAYTSQVKTADMYRDCDLDAKLIGAEEIMVVLYDLEGAVAEKLVFKGTEDTKSWFGENNLVSTTSWDITGPFNFYSLDGHDPSGRRFYINRSWGGCPNDQGYLMVSCGRQNGKPACSNYESVTPAGSICKIVHTTGPSYGRYGTSQTTEASAIEIHVKVGFEGFEGLFKYPNQAGVDVLSYFDSGITDPSQDWSALTASEVKTTEMYRSCDLDAKLMRAEEVMFVVYDSEGIIFDRLVFQGTGDKKSWFSKENLLSTTYWEITEPFNHFSINGDEGSGRRFYINRNWGGCPNDKGYLMVSCGRQIGKPACTNYESVTPAGSICKILYSTLKVSSRCATGQFATASAIEIFAKVASRTDGFESVFRYPNQAGVDALSYFDSGITDPSQDWSRLTAPNVKLAEMFRSCEMEAKLVGAQEIKVAVYDASGNVAEQLVFQGTGDKKSWFSKENLISTTSWDLRTSTGPFNQFSINGHEGSGRRFYINRSWGGCPNDNGYLMVSCGRQIGKPACTNYESVTPAGSICKILYSTGNSYGRFGTSQVVEASAIEILVKSN